MKQLELKIRKMWFVKPLLLALVFLCGHELLADKTKQALKAFQNGELVKTKEIVLKSIEKEGLTPGIGYVYSLLFANEDFENFDLDSAHFYILAARQVVSTYSAKQLDQLDVSKLLLEQQEDAVDSLSFSQTTDLGTVASYIHYIENYKDSKFLDRAVIGRDSIGFLQASKVNTWQSYEHFIEMYPRALDAEKARDLYDRLLYEDKTASADLAGLQEFLKEHPNSPYRNQTEKQIFQEATYLPDAIKIMDGLSALKNRELLLEGASLIYHFESSLDSVGKLLEPNLFQYFKDSVERLEVLNKGPLLPVFQDGMFGFVNANFETVLDLNYTEIQEDYLCGRIDADVLQVGIDEKRLLVNRQGHVLYNEGFETIQDLGLGLLRFSTKGKIGVIHKTGRLIVPPIYDDIELLDKKLLKFVRSGQAGLIGINGKVIVDAKFDDIFTEGGFWVFEKDLDLAVTSFEQIISLGDMDAVQLDFDYEEVELINEKFLICFAEDREVMLDAQLRTVVPDGTHRINTRFETWTVKQPFGYRVFNKELGELTHTLYDQVLQNNEWLALMRNNKWSVFNKSIDDEPIIGLDSVKLLGNDIAMIFRGLQGMAIFPNKRVVEFTEGEELRSLTSGRGSKAHFLSIKRNGKTLLYKDGEKLFESNLGEIGYISDSAFYVKQHGKYGAMGLDGNLIMRIRYDAIGEAVNGIAPVLYRGKFGGFNFRDKILLKLDFVEKLSYYGNDLLITVLDDKKGVLNVRNEVVLEPMFEDLVVWNDSIALVKEEQIWKTMNVFSEEVYHSGILDFDFILNSDEEKVLKIRSAQGYGVLSSTRGLIIKPTYSDLINLGTSEEPIFFGEKHVSEADFYVVVYMNADGEVLRSQAFRGEEYEEIVCEN